MKTDKEIIEEQRKEIESLKKENLRLIQEIDQKTREKVVSVYAGNKIHFVHQ